MPWKQQGKSVSKTKKCLPPHDVKHAISFLYSFISDKNKTVRPMKIQLYSEFSAKLLANLQRGWWDHFSSWWDISSTSGWAALKWHTTMEARNISCHTIIEIKSNGKTLCFKDQLSILTQTGCRRLNNRGIHQLVTYQISRVVLCCCHFFSCLFVSRLMNKLSSTTSLTLICCCLMGSAIMTFHLDVFEFPFFCGAVLS